MMETINSNMLWIPRKEISNLAELKKGLIARSRFNRDIKIPMYVEKKKHIGVPRYFLPYSTECRDDRSWGLPFTFRMKTEPRKGQQEVVDSVLFKISKKNATGFLLDVPTGGGKTYIVLDILSTLSTTALIVVYKSDLITHWVKEIRKHTTIKKSQIGIGEGGKIDWVGKKIVIALVHTLAKDRYPFEFKQMFGAVVFDEADRSVPPETFSSIAGMFTARYRIGISATLDRRDGLDVILKRHVGEYRITQTEVDKMDSKALIIRLKWWAGDVPSHLPVMVRRGILFKKMEASYERNYKIVRQIHRYLKAERRVIVASDRTVLLNEVKNMLVNSGILPEEKIGFYTRSLTGINVKVGPKGGIKKVRKTRQIKKEERERTAAECDVLLATYKMIEAGTNLPDVSGLILATPQSSATQVLGRIERSFKGKKFPVVTDFVEINYPDSVRWAEMREAEYRKRGLEIKIKEEQ